MTTASRGCTFSGARSDAFDVQRNRLLQAAAGAFANHGIREATVDDILEAEARRPGSPLDPIRRDLLDAASRELTGGPP